MFKAQTLNGVGQFNIHAEVVGIELELVAIGERLIFLHVHRERGDRPVYRKLPVFVLFGRSLKVDHADANAERLLICRSNVRSEVYNGSGVLLSAHCRGQAGQHRSLYYFRIHLF